MYARIENNQVVEWPIVNIRQLFPNTSFPASITDADLPDGYVTVGVIAPPQVPQNQKVVPGLPVQHDGKWVQSWVVVDLTPDELLQHAEQIKTRIIEATQQRLDSFANTRNYDSILSACTYATSTIPKFKIEGQYCVGARDATWAKLYEVLAEVESGTRPMPTGYADVEPELPVLEWPAE